MGRDGAGLRAAALVLAAALSFAAQGARAAADCDDVSVAALRAMPGADRSAPHVMLFKGTLPQVTLDSLARFLEGMGYPAARIARDADGEASQSGYQSSERIAGEVAWYVEHDGVAPILIGHSRGGMLVIRTLHELAGAFHEDVHVWEPGTDRPTARTTIRDPATGAPRPALGVAAGFAVAIATGKLPRLWQGQWDMLPRLRRIPDTAHDFLGFHIEGDLVSGDAFGIEPYVAIHAARVRNVVLPASYGHLSAVDTAHLAADPEVRAWIDRWRPGRETALPAGDVRNLGLGAELWHGIKRAWCRAARREGGTSG